MWCSFEKLCKNKPEKVEVGKYFSEINPKILMFNNKFLQNPNSNNINNQINPSNINNNQQPKDFSLSPDNYNQNKNIINLPNQLNFPNSNNNINTNENFSNLISNNINRNNNINNNNFNTTNSVSRFNVLGQKDEDSDLQSSKYSKYQVEFRAFTENSETEKQINTPVLNKDKIEKDYANLNNNPAFINQKPINSRPFTYSNSPNQIGQDLNKIICSSEFMNKYNNNNSSNTYNNLNNLNNQSSSHVDFSKKFLDSSNIRPFNFNSLNSGVNNNNNNNNEFTPQDPKETDLSGVQNNISGNPGNKINNNQQNIFQNIHLGEDRANYNNINNINKSNHFNTAGGNNNIFNNSNINTSNNNNMILKNNNFPQNNRSYDTYNSIKRSEGKSLNLKNYSTFNSGKFNDIGQLLKHFGEIIRLLSLYRCKETINLINELPKNHQNSGYVLSLLGKAHFEMAKYKECEKYYKECQRVEPARLEGMEYFSSCLWHLKEQYQLCNLANHVLEQSLFAPETWIVLGNSYSLQKEHEEALKYFSRAIQLNSSFAYAYTLCGHEHVYNESYVEAKKYFTQAISCDDR